ncbi:prepilin-type N-terminal cleavage/methylation domain-containing protein [Caldanaerobius fijiensis DSM 17918]|uniref:Prepilin-type N-terminal cleavage/methylation domain-containing protein n=1 Tax=Caldanaerobius fijiensis DSM 17918 TaxID=1121256 RepID=A0A1M4U3T3_9THEO|nr:prepilin-type N-terminal cleavage/methylation domain-containing protein [Caldanaerobius fijiensis]SHE51335.1 prepilin-type N-terminal cleavage/methylation domain-containing protein [Caldanaerobius fijiensis DSM 17918]
MSVKYTFGQRGFTLVELIITISLFSIVFLVVASFFRYELLSFRVLSDDAKLKVQMDDLMNSIVEDIRAVNDSDLISISADDSNFILKVGNDEYNYDKNDLKVYKNRYLLAEDIENFYVSVNERTINIFITGKGARRDYTLTTSVVLRR